MTGFGVLDGRLEPRDVTGEGVASSLINSLLGKCSSKPGQVENKLKLEVDVEKV